MTIDITVIVPFLDEERLIRQCIESLRATNYPKERVELIFVDNGSTDRGAAIAGEYPEVILLRETRGKVYTARNTALEHAAGRVIAFTDADCAVSPGWLAAIHDAILVRGATIAMGEVAFAPSSSEVLQMLETYRNDHIEYVIEHRIWNHLYGYTNNMAVRADVFERLGPFLELPVPGDTELVHRCLARLPDTEIVFRRDMHVDHLELVKPGVLFRKLVHYGEFHVHRPRVRYRRPHHRRKSGAERHTARKHRFSIRQRALFQLLLWATSVCLWTGRCRGWLHRALGKSQRARGVQ